MRAETHGANYGGIDPSRSDGKKTVVVEPIVQIGLFHLAEKHDDPFGSLTRAISKHANIARSLLVLPEAFNYGGVYHDNPPRGPTFASEETLQFLEGITRQHDTIIVVSVLEGKANRAYLVDKGGRRPMGYKSHEDSCAVDNPLETRGLSIGALICSDAQTLTYYRPVIDRIDQSSCARKVICVPASMSQDTFNGPDFPLPQYDGKYFILANSKDPPGESCGSFFANNRKKLGGKSFNDRHN